MLIVRARQPSPSPTTTSGTFSLGTPSSTYGPRFWANRTSYAARPNGALPIGVTIDLERVVHIDSGSVRRFGDAEVDEYALRDRVSAIELKDGVQAV